MSYPCVSCLRGLLFPTLAGWLVASTAFGQEPRLDLYGDPLPAGASARLGTLRFRHGGAVNSVGFLADGKTVVSGSDSGVYLWEAATGKELRMLPGFRAVVSPDGKTIATLDVNERQVHGRIHIIDAATLQTVRQLERGVTTLTLAFSPDGKTLAAGGHRVRNQNQVWLWELATGNELPSPALGRRYDSVYRLAFSPDGKTLATSGNRDDALRFWDLAEGTEQTPLGHNGQALAYAPDGKLLAVEGPDPADARNINSVVKLFDVESLKEVRLLSGLRGGIGAITFTPDAATVIAGDREGQLLLWDTATGKQRVALTAHRDGITALAVSLDGKRLVSGSRDRTLCVWDLATRQPLQTPVGHLGPITAVALSSDGKTAVTASADRSVLVWDLPACQEARRLPHSATVRAGVLSPDGKLLATKSWSDSGNEAHAHLWDLTAGKELRRLPEHYDWSRALAFSPDGRLLARGNNLAVELFDIAADRPLRRAAVSAAQADRTTVPFVAFAPDGKRFAWSNSALGQMTETATGNALGQFAFPRSPTLNDEAHWAAFTPDGALLVAQVENSIRVWDVARRQELRSFRADPQTGISQAALSPDGKMLATANLLGTIRLWELATGKERRELRGLRERTHGSVPRWFPAHQGSATAVAWSADGQRLITGGEDSTVLVWDLSLADESAPRQPDAQQLAGWWNDLASDEADRAYRAMRALATVPRQATSFFSERLRPVAAVEPRALAKLIADLDSRQFAVRQQAAEELEVLGSQAVPALQEVLKGEPSLEVRQRVEELLDEADRLILSGRALRTWRAIEVLEHLGTPEARQLLTNLGKGTPDSRLTREAQAALARCKRR